MVGTFCDFTIETKIDSKSHFTDTESHIMVNVHTSRRHDVNHFQYRVQGSYDNRSHMIKTMEEADNRGEDQATCGVPSI